MASRITAARAAVSFGGCALAATPAPIQLRHGWVQGTSERNLIVYRGIPFTAVIDNKL
jgi:hypothetical protein